MLTFSPSLIEAEEIDSVLKFGLSSLIRLKLSEDVSELAFSIVPKSTWIVSIISTLLSSSPSFAIIIWPDDSPALIIKGEDVIVYSESTVAVPDVVKGIVISLSEILSSFTVIMTESSNSSYKFCLLDSKVKLDGSSLSVNVTVISSVDEKVPEVEE